MSASTSTTSATQGLVSHHFALVDGDWERRSMPFRYVSPAELDLMARARRDDGCASAGAAGSASRSRATAHGTSRSGRSPEACSRLGRSTLGSSSAPLPTWVVMAVYLVRELDLSPLELVLMGTAMEAAVFLLRGADRGRRRHYSRKLSLIIGYVGMGVAWMRGRPRLGALADHRALGALGPLLHVHERRPTRPGSPTRSAWRTSGAFSCAAERWGHGRPVLGLSGRSRSASSRSGRRDRRRCRLRCVSGSLRFFLMPETRLPPGGRAGSGVGVRGVADDRRRGCAFCVGGSR